MNKKHLILLFLCFLVFVVSCKKESEKNPVDIDPDSQISITSVSIKPATTLLVGATEQLTASITPAEATNQNVTWDSSDSSKVTVSADGLITGVAVGSAIITVTTLDGSKTATCVVDITIPIGWEVNENNTGLRGDYSNLTTINPGDVGNVQATTLYVTKNNINISDKHIPYQVIVSGTGVVFERCRFQPTTTGLGSPLMRAMETRTVFRDCEMDFSVVPLERVYMSIGITMWGDLYRCNIYGSSTGVSFYNINSTETSVAEGNYIHDLRYQTPAHVDGLTIRRCDGTGGIALRNNNIVTDVPATGALFIQAYIGPIDNVLIEGNLLQGFGHCIALDYNAHGYGTNMTARNNRLDAWTIDGGGHWYESVAGGTGWKEWGENYAFDINAPDCKGAVIVP